MWSKKLLVLANKKAIFLLSLFFVSYYSQSQTIHLRPLTVDEGLPQGQVRGIVQDRQGFIWIASEGLSRYDGRGFYNLNNIFGNKESISTDLILDLSIDNDDDIWASYNTKEVDVIQATTGKVRHISTEPSFRWLREQLPLRRINIRQAGGRLFTVNSMQLVAFNKQTGEHRDIPLPTGERIMALGGNTPDKVLLATTKALYELRGNNLLKIFQLPSFPDALHVSEVEKLSGPSISIGRVIEYAGGNLAITAVNGVIVYNKNLRTSTYHGSISKPVMPTSIVRSSDDKVYYLLGDGLYQLSGNEYPTQVFRNSSSFMLNTYLLMDRSGILWAGAGIDGVRLIDLKPSNFHSLPGVEGFGNDVLKKWLPDVPPDRSFGAYSLRSGKDKQNNLLIQLQSWKNMSGIPDRRTLQVKLYRFSGDRLTAVDSSDRDHEMVYFAIGENNTCWQVLFDKTQLKRFLVKKQLGNMGFTVFTTLPGGWKENGYLSTVGRYIVYLTDDELRLYDSTDAARCVVYSKARLGVGGALLQAFPDRNDKNVLWIATKGSGIVKLNILSPKLKHYTEAEGLPNNTVYFMAPDKRGDFWCTSNKGLFRFSPTDGRVVAFTVKDGLQGNEFNRYHFIETPDGHFYFGGTHGFTWFHPDSVYLDNFQPPVVITGLQVNNTPLQQLDPSWKDSLTSNLQSITLPYHQNQLSFDFAGLQFDAPEKLQYRYRLRGIDNDWILAGYNTSASYAAIPPGDYVLMVNASNTSGQWSSYVRTLAITIRPPWWRTWWMYAVYVLILAGAVYLFMRTRLRRLRLHQEVVLRQKEAEQAQAMEETKTRFFANVTHELRTPLTLILTPVQKELHEGKETPTPQLLKGIHRNAQILQRLINQLLDMSKLEGGRMPLLLHRGQLSGFIESLLPPFEQQAMARQIAFSFESHTSENEHLFDSDKMEKIVHNLLGNAMKFTPEGGLVKLIIAETPLPQTGAQEVPEQRSVFTIQFVDTGIGIAPEELPHIFKRFYQANVGNTRKYEGTGIGLSLVKEFTELMGGSIQAESKPGNGSVFTLTLPLTIATGSEVDGTAMPGHEPQADVFNAAAAAPPQEEAIEKPLVLVAEDNEELRHFIKEALSVRYRVMTAPNGEAGVQMATSELPELIISDLMMPVMDGYEFCRKIKTTPLTSHIGFILLTAKTATESRITGLRSGADHYINKPFLVEELLLTVGNLLQRQQQLREFYSRQIQQPAEGIPAATEIEDDFLRGIYTVIDLNINSDQLNVDFLASELAMSRRTLNRKLAVVAGTSANEIIRHYRLKRAAELLLRGKAVSAVAYDTGFSTPSWFSQCFKEMYGVTPAQYAQNGSLSQN